MVTRGFFGKKDKNDRVPPGQYLENRFPVLSAEPTPKINLEDWNLSIIYNNETLAEINWDTLKSLPSSLITKDIHCVTRWTKFDMNWKGVKISTLFENLKVKPPTDLSLIHI